MIFLFDEIKAIPGKIKYGKQYEEYHVDFEKLRQMVMDAFYEKKKYYIKNIKNTLQIK